jgi:LmbE family N-acetylglucosaminyl deacetylase
MRVAPTWFAALLTARALAADGAGGAAAPPADGDPAALPRIDSSTSLLIVAPHPDDETLCCGGVIERVVRAGGRVAVVWLTSGDAARLDLMLMSRSLFPGAAVAHALGAQRMQEARTATARLGVSPAGQLFLGYPDGGLLELIGRHRSSAYTSPTSGASAVPYGDALYPRHPYTGVSLERDFLGVLERVQPNLILAPTPLDAHPDHRAAGLIAQASTRRYAGAPVLRYWIVHGGEGWPSPPGLLPGVPLTPAPRAGSLSAAAFELEPAEEDGKLFALQAYRSQMRVMAPFLLSFVRTDELYSAHAH